MSIAPVSAIFTFKLILPFNILTLSTNDLLIVVESLLNFNVIAVESLLNLVVIAIESNKILALIAVESDLNLPAETAESLRSLSRIELILSINAPLALVPSIMILLDKETVSRANLLASMFAVSAILTFRFILLLKLVAIVEESDLSLAVMTVESNKIFALNSLTLSVKAPPEDAPS